MTDHLSALINLALAEDIGTGDITTKATIDPKRQGEAIIRAKESLVVAGLCVAETVFSMVDTKLTWQANAKDGDRVDAGISIAHVRGSLATLLTAERTALNFLQRLSGIATLTRRFVDTVSGTNVKILDTRKTTPGWRALEKGAVRAGGGENHRFGLFDRYLIKNNHIAAAGSLEKTIELVGQTGPHPLLEVETRTLEDVAIAIRAGADIIMLDNMTVEQVREAVITARARRRPPSLEVSGNITLENIRSYASTGVDCISIGAITHSAPAADIHMTIT